MAWHDFGRHHSRRGKIDVVLWGSPGCGRPGADGQGSKLDAEALTRGRRQATPLIQQCDVIFPLPKSVTGTPNETEGMDEISLKEKSRALLLLTQELGAHFYYRTRGPLVALLEEPFLLTHVLRSNFCALALNAASDHGNSFAILPRGQLILSLDRESFQAMGLPGEAAPLQPLYTGKRLGARCDRYVLAIDLSAKSFRPGKPLRERVLSALARGRLPDADMAVCWWEDDSGYGNRAQGGTA
ncbi:unnamed protein product, partial [Discosporangium mesarthrocarpum]